MTAPLTVLYANHTSALGGAEKSLLRLLECLDRDEVRPLLAAPVGPELAVAAATTGVPAATAPMGTLHRTSNPVSLVSQGLMVQRAGRRLAELCEQEHVDLVHCNSLPALLTARVLAPRLPLIWHARDLRTPRQAVLAAVEASALVVAVSRAVADFVLEAVPQAAEKLVVIHDGLTRQDTLVTRSRQQMLQEWGLEPGARLVGCMGRMAPWKRHDLFLRAGARLLGRLPDVRLIIAGADMHGRGQPLAAQLRALAMELGIADRVVWVGYRPDAPNVLGALDVLVHPAADEPCGRAVLEALALGVPVVATRTGGPAEIVEHGRSGLLVRPDEYEVLYRAAQRILSDQGLADTLREGALRRSRHFEAHAPAALMAATYRQVRRTRQTTSWRWWT